MSSGKIEVNLFNPERWAKFFGVLAVLGGVRYTKAKPFFEKLPAALSGIIAAAAVFGAAYFTLGHKTSVALTLFMLAMAIKNYFAPGKKTTAEPEVLMSGTKQLGFESVAVVGAGLEFDFLLPEGTNWCGVVRAA